VSDFCFGFNRNSILVIGIESISNSIATNSSKSRIQGKKNRTDQKILQSSFGDLSGAEFERLLALYFRDQGYKVQEVGIGGSDGGVDLVITDQRGEKTVRTSKMLCRS